MADPRIGLVTLTRVDVSPGPRQRAGLLERGARRPASADGAGAGAERTEQGLARAASFLRRRLAEELPLRRVPELHFRHDPSLALGSEMLSLLREIRDDEGR